MNKALQLLTSVSQRSFMTPSQHGGIRRYSMENTKSQEYFNYYFGQTEIGTITFLADQVVIAPSEIGVDDTSESCRSVVEVQAKTWFSKPFECDAPTLSTRGIDGVDFEDVLYRGLQMNEREVQPCRLRQFCEPRVDFK